MAKLHEQQTIIPRKRRTERQYPRKFERHPAHSPISKYWKNEQNNQRIEYTRIVEAVEDPRARFQTRGRRKKNGKREGCQEEGDAENKTQERE